MHLHRWSDWSDAIATLQFIWTDGTRSFKSIQERRCLRCNKRKRRNIT